MNIREYREQLWEEGYWPGIPVSRAQVVRADAPITAEAVCEKCGHVGRPKGPGYVGLAVCPRCGEAQEF